MRHTLTDFSQYLNISGIKIESPDTQGLDTNSQLTLAQINWIISEMANNFEVIKNKLGDDLNKKPMYFNQLQIGMSPSEKNTLSSVSKAIGELTTKVIDQKDASHIDVNGVSVAEALRHINDRLTAIEKVTKVVDTTYARADGTTNFPHIILGGHKVEMVD